MDVADPDHELEELLAEEQAIQSAFKKPEILMTLKPQTLGLKTEVDFDKLKKMIYDKSEEIKGLSDEIASVKKKPSDFWAYAPQETYKPLKIKLNYDASIKQMGDYLDEVYTAETLSLEPLVFARTPPLPGLWKHSMEMDLDLIGAVVAPEKASALLGCGCKECNEAKGQAPPKARVAFGSLGKLPKWVSRFTPEVATPYFTDKWPIMKVAFAQSICDFYLLEGITSQLLYPVPVQPPKVRQFLGGEDGYNKWQDHGVTPITSIVETAASELNALIELLDQQFQWYIIIACGGEVRHHPSLRKKLPGGRKSCWTQFISIYEEVGPSIMLELAAIFEKMRDGSVGGPKWAQAARICHSRLVGEMDARTFVDRCFSLQHNNGSLFNKWFFTEGSVLYLDAHASNPPNLRVLWERSTLRTRQLWTRYWSTANAISGQDLHDPTQPKSFIAPPPLVSTFSISSSSTPLFSPATTSSAYYITAS